MASLAKLLADHGSLLVLDAASTRIQVGLLRGNAAPIWQSPSGDSGTAVFAGVAAVLGAGNLDVGDVGAFAFCDGPGSMLGVRTVAMALRTWNTLRRRPTYAYRSLVVAAAWQVHHAPGSGFAMIADARRDTWHCIEVDDHGTAGPMRRIATTDLPAARLVTPENFRTWSKLAPAPATGSYDIAQILADLPAADVFGLVAEPDAFQHEAPVYQRWTPQVHQAAKPQPR